MTPTLSTSAASGGVALAIVTLAVWALGLHKIVVPGDVVAALMALATPAVHIAALKLGGPAVAAVVDSTPVSPAPVTPKAA